MDLLTSKGWNCIYKYILCIPEPLGVGEDQNLWYWGDQVCRAGLSGIESLLGIEGRVQKAYEGSPVSASWGHVDHLLAQGLIYFSF
jgi:hypothetical protein